MTLAVRASILAAAAIAAVAPVRAQDGQSHSHLIPLPHPELLYPNEPALPPQTLHPRVMRPRPAHPPRHQHMIPLPHPELLYPHAQASFDIAAGLDPAIATSPFAIRFILAHGDARS